MNRFRIVVLTLTLGLLAGCDELLTLGDDPTDPYAQVAEQVAAALGDEVRSFVIVDLPVAQVVSDLNGGLVRLPFLDPNAEVVELDLPAARVQLRAAGVTTGGLRSGPINDPSIQAVPLPPEQNYSLGNCITLVDQPDGEFEACGALTVMDQAQTMLRAMVLSSQIGTAIIEPVDLVIGGRSNPNLHLVYNAVHTPPVVFSGDEEGATEGAPGFGQSPDIARQTGLVQKRTGIVLDGDVTFYDIDPETVWSRQASIMNVVRILYGLVEPLGSGTWQLLLDIKGQEVWITGGPTTTDKVELTDELEDPDYFLIHPVEDEELHLLFTGYAVSGVFGRASGIGTTSGFGGAAGKNHAYSGALKSQSFKTKWVVAAHELGHLIGGAHSAGVTSGCAGGLVNHICGISIMPAGSAGGPETRQPYFSDANDTRIANVLDAILP
jgi:hypothetical protein